jgi:hypothetical protein
MQVDFANIKITEENSRFVQFCVFRDILFMHQEWCINQWKSTGRLDKCPDTKRMDHLLLSENNHIVDYYLDKISTISADTVAFVDGENWLHKDRFGSFRAVEQYLNNLVNANNAIIIVKHLRNRGELPKNIKVENVCREENQYRINCDREIDDFCLLTTAIMNKLRDPRLDVTLYSNDNYAFLGTYNEDMLFPKSTIIKRFGLLRHRYMKIQLGGSNSTSLFTAIASLASATIGMAIIGSITR